MMLEENLTVDVTHPEPLMRILLSEVITGLSHAQKKLPAKLLYDQRGSEIFEKICRLPSYYPTRTETKILQGNAPEITKLIGENSLIIEPGSGAAEKVRILLSSMSGRIRYVPIEISREILLRTSQELIQEYDGVEVFPVCADFTKNLSLPLTVGHQTGKKVLFFPGSTIGNFEPDEARNFLSKASQMVGPCGGILIGVDTKKDPETLRLAYNDPEGVTSDFNLNLLARLNREMNADFIAHHFRHEAIYNEEKGRVEMHLKSLLPQLVRVNQTLFRFQEGETIHTENSYKYSVDEFSRLGETAGLSLVNHWVDEGSLFSVYYFSIRGRHGHT